MISVKYAIYKSELNIKRYIICEPVLVTGYEWIMTEDENGKTQPTYCIISGNEPGNSLSLSYDFMSADNQFVFYPIEKKEYYSEELQENVVEYIVEKWDILYPVKHGNILDIIPMSHAITKLDCN